MKKAKKLLAVLFGVVMLVSCMTTSVFAAETGTQDGLKAVIQTDKESYAANEDIQITITATNTNSFEVKNVSIESLLPDTLTLKDGDLKSKTVDLAPGETLSISCVAVLEKDESTTIVPTTTEPETTEPTTEIIEGELTTVDNTPDNPDTGSGSTIIKVLLIALAAAAVVATIILITRKNSKKATKVISLVLCGAIAVSSFATVGFIKVGAEEGTQLYFMVDKTIIVDSEEYTIYANTSYNQAEEGTIKLYSDPKELDTSNEPQKVLFYIDTENTTNKLNVTLMDGLTNQKVGVLLDDGLNRDESAHDGIYSGIISVDCSKEKTVQYYAVIDDGISKIKSKTRKINIFAPITDKESEDMATVDNALKVLTESDNYKGASNKDKKKQIESELKKLKKEHLISSYRFSPDNSAVEYTYSNGISAYWSVTPPKRQKTGGSLSPNLLPEETNRNLRNLSRNASTYNSSQDILFIHGWNDNTMDSWYSDEAAPIYTGMGYPVTCNYLPSVEEYKTLLTQKDYCYIVIAEHGTDIWWGWFGYGIATDEQSTKEKDKEYSQDLKGGNGQRIKKWGSKYVLLPEFFSFYYEDVLDGSIIDMQSCMGTGKGDDLNYNFASSFLDDCNAEAYIGYHNPVYINYTIAITATILNNMITNSASIGNAYTKALEEHQYNDVEYMYNKYPSNDPIWTSTDESGKTFADEVAEREAAYPSLVGNPNVIFATGKLGTISGKICMASDRTTPIGNATINIYRNDALYKTLNSDINGNYTVNLPVGSYRLEITSDGYIAFDAYATVTENNNTYMETFLLVEGEEGQTGTATGKIKNALTGNGISDVQLSVRKGWNNASFGEVVSTVTTNENGDYTLNLPFGNYTVYATKDGYISNTFNIIVQQGTTSNQDGTVTPIISGDNYRIVLTWDENPRDLDSHVEGKLENGSSFHVYYGHQSQYDGEIEVCNLDVDDTTSYGPETITLNATSDAPYYYYIKRFAGYGTVGTSGAQINVYQGENLVATFNVPTDQGNGDYWNVFAIVNGELIAKNTITSSADTSYANS